MKPEKIEVNKLKPVPNVCNQILREVWKSKDISIAHVIIKAGDISLSHKHKSFTEIYYILEGRGILTVGDEKLEVKNDTIVIIKPNTPHMLKNIGKTQLKHMVISTPKFNPKDVVLLND